MLSENRRGFRSAEEELYRSYTAVENRFTENTTIGVVVTNAKFSKAKLCKIADMAHDGLARSIRPVHTSADGDSIYSVSLGSVEADADVAGSLAADVLSEAVIRAIYSSEGAYGFPAANDIHQ